MRDAALPQHPNPSRLRPLATNGALLANGLAPVDLKLDHITRLFGETVAVADMSFVARCGEFISLLGPSGCGKTTTLSMIAGFLDPTSGTIEIRGRRVEGLPPERRNAGMVFQNYALFPHMSVAENVGFGLRMRRVAKDEIRLEVRKALEMVRMSGFEERRPSQLSGGQQQRVALARALVIRPYILLLDEPFGALDRQLREEMQLELKTLQQSVGITTVFVTHDQHEALSMSSRIAVMNKGIIEQVGSPVEIYERPQTTFVARFIGKSNVFPGTITAVGVETAIDTTLGHIALSSSGGRLAPGDKVNCIVRPEKMHVVHIGSSTPDECSTPARITQIVYQGSTIEFLLTVGNMTLIAMARPQTGALGVPLEIGAEVELAWSPEDTLVFHQGERCK